MPNRPRPDRLRRRGRRPRRRLPSIAASSVTIADLTVQRAWFHPIHVASFGGNRVTGTLIHNVRVIDAGQGLGVAGRTYGDDPCPDVPTVGHFGGLIRNDAAFVNDAGLFASDFGFDTGIALEQACGVSVLHNTVFSTQARSRPSNSRAS